MDKKPLRLGQLIKQFQKVYDLKDFERCHEGVHAMTGFGIGVADELRVAVIEGPLYRRHTSLQDSLLTEGNLLSALVTWLKGWRASQLIIPSTMETQEYRKTQIATVRLEREEVRALHALGKKMHYAIHALTGREYIDLTPQQVASLDFSKVDFVSEAQAIKRMFEKRENHVIAEKTAEIFYKAARAKNKDQIPAAGSPWHGPQMRSYAALKKARAQQP